MSQRSTTRLYMAALTMDVCFFCAWAAIPFLVRQGGGLQLSDGALGALRALSSGTYIFGAFFLAPRFDVMNKTRLVRLAAILVACSWMLASVSKQAWLLFILLPGGGLALSGFWPNVMAMVGESGGRDLARRIGSFNCWWCSGKACAFLFCGSLLEVWGRPFLVIGICGLVTLLVLVLMPARSQLRTPAPASSEPEPPGPESLFRAALLLLFVSFFVGTSYEVHLPKGFGPELVADAFGGAYALGINALLFFMYLGTLLAFLAMRQGVGWIWKPRNLLVAGALLATSQGALALRPSILVTGLLLLLSGFASGLAYGQCLFYAQAGRADRARRAGIHEGTLSLGTALGPLISGVLLDVSGDPMAVPVLCFGAAGLAALSVAVQFLRRP